METQFAQLEALRLLDDKDLRQHVRFLVDLLGEVINERSGETVFQAVEQLRKGFIRLRKQDDPLLRNQLMAQIGELDPAPLREVIRAFNLYLVWSIPLKKLITTITGCYNCEMAAVSGMVLTLIH